MKKLFLSFLVFLFVNQLGYAQDFLIKKSGDTLKVKVMEVTDDAFRYKKTNNLDGPTFVTNKSELIKVIYANGTEEKIEAKAAPAVVSPDPAKPSEPTIDTRTSTPPANKYSNPITSDFEVINIERFGYYYKGMRMNDTRLNYLFRSYNNTEIMKEFQSAKSMKTISTITGIVGIPLAVGGVLMSIVSFIPVEKYDNTSGDYETTFPNRGFLGPGIGLFAGFIALEVTSAVLKGVYKSRVKKTVQHYNNVVAKHEVK